MEQEATVQCSGPFHQPGISSGLLCPPRGHVASFAPDIKGAAPPSAFEKRGAAARKWAVPGPVDK